MNTYKFFDASYNEWVVGWSGSRDYYFKTEEEANNFFKWAAE